MAEVWVKYPLRNIEIGLLRKLKKDAKREKRSLSDYIRSILCEHYGLECAPSEASSKLEHGARQQLLRLQPELHKAIKEDAAETGLSMRGLMLEALESRYVTEEDLV